MYIYLQFGVQIVLKPFVIWHIRSTDNANLKKLLYGLY